LTSFVLSFLTKKCSAPA